MVNLGEAYAVAGVTLLLAQGHSRRDAPSTHIATSGDTPLG